MLDYVSALPSINVRLDIRYRTYFGLSSNFEKFLSDNQSYGFDSVKIEECQEHISNIKKLFLEGS